MPALCQALRPLALPDFMGLKVQHGKQASEDTLFSIVTEGSERAAPAGHVLEEEPLFPRLHKVRVDPQVPFPSPLALLLGSNILGFLSNPLEN